MCVFFNYKKSFIDCNDLGASRVVAVSVMLLKRVKWWDRIPSVGGGVDTRRLQGFYLAISLYVYSYIYYLFLRWVVTFETTSIETNTTNVYVLLFTA